MRVLLLVTLGYCCIKECTLSASSARNDLKDLQATSRDAPTMTNETATFKALSLQPNTVRRLVTDVNSGGHKLAEIFEDKDSGEVLNCNLLGDKDLITKILKAVPDAVITDVTTDEMNQVVDKCGDEPSNTTESSLLNTLGTIIQSLVIFPGTKWCGAGDVAKDYDDLGRARGTDMCCRDHDHSNDSIPAFGKEHGLRNPMIYTMTDCADDTEFFNCLLNDSSTTSLAVGTIFFDILNTKCFEYGYPTECTDYNLLRLLQLQKPCEHREENTSKPKEWHIVSPPSFVEAYVEHNKT